MLITYTTHKMILNKLITSYHILNLFLLGVELDARLMN